MCSPRLLRSLRACGSLPSFITWLALATSPVCSAFRFPISRPTAPFAPPTIATHQDMADGMHGRLASESEEQVQTTSYQANALHARHLSSEQYLDTACGDAASDASTGSGHGDRAAAVAEAPCLIEAVPRSTRNGAGVLQIETSGTARVPAGRSTRLPSTRLPSTRLPTRGRRLRSCCMKAGDMGLEDGPSLAQLPKRPPGARYLLSRSDAGTLTVTLPPAGYIGLPSFPLKAWPLLPIAAIFLYAVAPDLVNFCVYVVAFPFAILSCIASGETVPPEVLAAGLAIYAILGCAGAPWLAVQAFTTTTLSVGEFQWEYKETVAGMRQIPTCYRQGETEELNISRDGDKIMLITGLTRVEVGRRNVGALSNEELNWVVDSVQAYQRQITAI